MPRIKHPNTILFASVALLIGAILIVAGAILARELLTPAPAADIVLPNTDVTVISPPQPVADWTLTDSNNQPFSASQLDGKPSVLFFGFANCPDICPLTLREFQRVRQSLGDDGERVNFVFISVDGNRDTPQALQQRLAQLGIGDDIIALTGDPETVRSVGRPLSVDFIYSQPNEAGFYTVDHTASYFLLDEQRRWVMRFAFGINRVVILETLQSMLAPTP